jgi:hypothetical protein
MKTKILNFFFVVIMIGCQISVQAQMFVSADTLKNIPVFVKQELELKLH